MFSPSPGVGGAWRRWSLAQRWPGGGPAVARRWPVRWTAVGHRVSDTCLRTSYRHTMTPQGIRYKNLNHQQHALVAMSLAETGSGRAYL